MVQLLTGLSGNAVLTQNPEPTLGMSNHGMSNPRNVEPRNIEPQNVGSYIYLAAPLNVEFFKSFFVCLVYLCKKELKMF